MSEAVVFVRAGRPPTSNKNIGVKGRQVQGELAKFYSEAGGGFSDEHRYGIVYYFVRGYRPTNDADAGNVSKRVWDALEGTAYRDDHVVRFQIAGLIECGEAPSGEVAFGQGDMTDVPDSVFGKLLQMLDDAETQHVLYVEIGPIRPTMFTFNLAARQGRGA
jgi:hypothetical protein